MRQPLTCFRWLCALCVLCVYSSSVRAETDLELVAKIDAAVAKAVKFLASKQSPDGAWRSDVYAPFKEGDALTPLVMTALLPLPIDANTEEPCERGMKYLAELSKLTFEKEDGLKSLAYPVYTAANTTIALHQNRRAEDEAIRAKWVQALRDLQLTEATGWKPEDVEFGGWTYGHAAAKKPQDGAVLGSLDQPNMSATAFALIALQAAGMSVNDNSIVGGVRIVRRLENGDGGFYFIHADEVRNKAGVHDGTDIFRSYGSATTDGLRALIAGGLGATGPARKARVWLQENFVADAHPGEYASDRSAAQNGLYFYWAAGMAAVFHVDEPSADASQPAKLTRALIQRQRPEGDWSNDSVDQREDDPLVATSFAIQALSNCRAMFVKKTRPATRQCIDGSLTCHARDATCHGEKLQYEPQPQKNTVGYWVNEKDWASWQTAVENPGEFDVVVLQGCGAGQGGREVSVGIGDESIKFTVEDTGHFQHFKSRSVGKLKISSAGTHELTLKCLHKAKDAVADVRQIRLVPVKVE